VLRLPGYYATFLLGIFLHFELVADKEVFMQFTSDTFFWRGEMLVIKFIKPPKETADFRLRSKVLPNV
jgi:hypothetical protein